MADPCAQRRSPPPSLPPQPGHTVASKGLQPRTQARKVAAWSSADTNELLARPADDKATLSFAAGIGCRRTLPSDPRWRCARGATHTAAATTQPGKTGRRIRMREYEIVDTNADNISACSICGRKPGRTEGHRRKCDWLKKRYAEGLRYKVLR